MKKIILIPVYNEKKNIKDLFNKIRKYNKYDILYVNDNSEDGTTQEINKLKKKYKNIYHINRINNFGIGSAHKDGLEWGYKKKYEQIITMDGDGTHDPKYLKAIINKNLESDITITNRFLKKNSLSSWPIIRIFITKVRHVLVNFFLGIKFDASGGFRCINAQKVKINDLVYVKENDYTYFWKSIFFLNLKYKINEIPIYLPTRKLGNSKMRIKHIIYSFISLLLFSLRVKITNKTLKI